MGSKRGLAWGAMCLLALVTVPATARASGTELGARWTAQLGSDAADLATGVAVRPDGSVVVAGTTSGTMPDASSAGGSDVFVAAYGPDGRRLWVRQFGGAGIDRATGLAVDAQGDAYVSGYTNNRMPPGDSIGAGDAVLAKVGGDGTLVWLRQFGTTGSDYARGVALDATGNVFVAGDTNGTLEGAVYGGGDGDAFIAKYDASGDLVWQRQFGSAGDDRLNGIAVDPSGNVLVTGVTTGALPTNRSRGGKDAFLAKYDNNGQRVWVRQFGSEAADFAYAVAAGANGGSYVAGYTYGSMPGQTSSGNIDAFLAHFDANGNRVGVEQFGGDQAALANAVTVAPSGTVLVGGWANYDVTSTSGDPGSWHAFVLAFDAMGIRTAARQFGANGMEQPVALAVAGDGSVVVATSGTLATDAKPAPSGMPDALLIRFPALP